MIYSYKNIDIKKLVVGPILTNCYLIDSNKFDAAILIDPGAEFDIIFEELNGKKVHSVLLTHGHFDHFSALNRIIEKYNPNIYVHNLDYELLFDSIKNCSKDFLNKDVILNTNEKIKFYDDYINLLDINFKIIHTPGHTKGSVCIKVSFGGENIMFTGDTLFKNGYGRYDLYGGSYSDIIASVKKLLKISEKHICLCGHGEDGIIGK